MIKRVGIFPHGHHRAERRMLSGVSGKPVLIISSRTTRRVGAIKVFYAESVVLRKSVDFNSVRPVPFGDVLSHE